MDMFLYVSPVSIKECLCLFFYAPQNVKNYEKLIKLCTHQIILNMCDGDENGENSTEIFFSFFYGIKNFFFLSFCLNVSE